MIRSLITALLLPLAIPALADGEGVATISPGPEVLAGMTGTWEITYTPGPEGIRPGGGLRLPLSGFPIRLFSAPQSDNPAGPNYVTARCSNPNVELTCRAVSELRQGWMQVEEVQVRVGEPGLPADEEIVVTYGDTSGGGPGGTIRGAEGDGLPIRMSSDTDGDGEYARLAEYPGLTLIGASAAKLAVCAPSEAVVGEPVLVSVSARDGRNAVATQSLPEVTLDGPTLAKPVEITFTEGQRAVAHAEVTFRRRGVHRLTATASGESAGLVSVLPVEFLSTTTPEADYDPEFRPEVTKVEISAVEARQGSTMRVVSHWVNSGTAAPKHEYRIMCHLQRRPAAGRALANWDHNVPVQPAAWTPGVEITATRIGSILPSVPDGKHALVLGLYHSPEPGEWAKPVAYDICWVEVGPDRPLISDVAPGRSNPIDVLAKPRERRLLWGDLHCHTENSGDGSGMVEALYNYARDTARLDFTACSDHVSHKYPKDQWLQIQQLAEGFNDPGKFVSILGYEWSNGWHGDKNVYFTGDYEAIRVPESGEAEDLWPMLKGVDCIVIPHHPAYPVGLRGMDWGRIDESLVPAVEMCSAHGLAEYLGNPR
ncbi:MAG TPA: DUF3604 domain-containing protein, partial [Armatimonadota bacterium]|nr:DUF3604 domain-containing protein [Armatimonadota bacterium]